MVDGHLFVLAHRRRQGREDTSAPRATRLIVRDVVGSLNDYRSSSGGVQARARGEKILD